MSKHIHIIHCWVSERVEDKEMAFSYVASAENVAGILTKALFKPAFEHLRGKLGLLPLERQMGEGEEKLGNKQFFIYAYLINYT